MPTFLAAVRLDPGKGIFVIRSPDFPDMEARCDDFNRAFALAEETLRARVRREVAERGSVDAPTRLTKLTARARVRAQWAARHRSRDGLPTTRARVRELSTCQGVSLRERALMEADLGGAEQLSASQHAVLDNWAKLQLVADVCFSSIMTATRGTNQSTDGKPTSAIVRTNERFFSATKQCLEHLKALGLEKRAQEHERDLAEVVELIDARKERDGDGPIELQRREPAEPSA